MGPYPGIIAHVDERAVFHCDGGGCAEGFINRIDGPVDVSSISFLGVTDPCQRQDGGHKQQKDGTDAEGSLPEIHLIAPYFCPWNWPDSSLLRTTKSVLFFSGVNLLVQRTQIGPLRSWRLRGKMGFSVRAGQGIGGRRSPSTRLVG